MCQASTQRTSRPYAKVKIRTSEHGRVLNVALSAMLQCGIIMCGKFEGFPQKGYVVLWGSSVRALAGIAGTNEYQTPLIII